VLQMEGGGHADVLPVLQVHASTADAVPCEGLRQNSIATNWFQQGLPLRPVLPHQRGEPGAESDGEVDWKDPRLLSWILPSSGWCCRIRFVIKPVLAQFREGAFI